MRQAAQFAFVVRLGHGVGAEQFTVFALLPSHEPMLFDHGIRVDGLLRHLFLHPLLHSGEHQSAEYWFHSHSPSFHFAKLSVGNDRQKGCFGLPHADALNPNPSCNCKQDDKKTIVDVYRVLIYFFFGYFHIFLSVRLWLRDRTGKGLLRISSVPILARTLWRAFSAYIS
jgi:hypothetical protein